MFNYDLLIGRIKGFSNDANYSKVAKAAGMSVTTLRRRLTGEPFDSSEILDISNALGISADQREDYFFTRNVQLN